MCTRRIKNCSSANFSLINNATRKVRGPVYLSFTNIYFNISRSFCFYENKHTTTYLLPPTKMNLSVVRKYATNQFPRNASSSCDRCLVLSRTGFDIVTPAHGHSSSSKPHSEPHHSCDCDRIQPKDTTSPRSLASNMGRSNQAIEKIFSSLSNEISNQD